LNFSTMPLSLMMQDLVSLEIAFADSIEINKSDAYNTEEEKNNS